MVANENRPQAAEDGTYDAADPRRWIALGVLLVAAAMDLIDTTVATLALPVIQDDLRASDAALEWIVAGYALAFGLGLITGGRLGDVLGRRRVFLVGLAGFTASSALCGLALDPTMLVASRVLQGAFAALMIPQVLSIIAASFPPGDRARAFGVFGAVAGVATVVGPLLSGVLLKLDLLGWRPIFLINVPIGLATIAAARAFVYESRPERPPRLDLLGVALLTLALILLLVPLVEGHQLGWPAWMVGAMAASVPALALFALHQLRRERRDASPLVPPSLFRRRAFTGGMIATLAFFSGPPALFFAVTVGLQGLGLSPIETALTFVPLSLASVPAAAASVALAPRLGRGITLGGALIVVLGIATVLIGVEMKGAELTSWTLLPGLVLAGLGLGLVAPTLIDVVLAGVDPRDAGAASGVRSTASQLGGAIGVALIGLTFYGTLPAEAPPVAPVYADALVRALWYALAVAIFSMLAMLLLPRPGSTSDERTQPARGAQSRGGRAPAPNPASFGRELLESRQTNAGRLLSVRHQRARPSVMTRLDRSRMSTGCLPDQQQ
jgi:EmrB/QacA subfamily drug resistance transporter